MDSTTTGFIVETLTRSIVEHRLQPGAKLVEQTLADQFGVSRTLIRQALFKLSQNRLIRMEPARGAFVAAPSIAEAQQVFAVRRMLEAEMTRAFIREVTPARIKALRDHVAHFEQRTKATRLARLSVRTKDAGPNLDMWCDFAPCAAAGGAWRARVTSVGFGIVAQIGQAGTTPGSEKCRWPTSRLTKLPFKQLRKPLKPGAYGPLPNGVKWCVRLAMHCAMLKRTSVNWFLMRWVKYTRRDWVKYRR